MTDAAYDLDEALSAECQGTCAHEPDAANGGFFYGDFGLNIRWNAVAGMWLCSRCTELLNNYWLNIKPSYYFDWMPKCPPTSESTLALPQESPS